MPAEPEGPMRGQSRQFYIISTQRILGQGPDLTPVISDAGILIAFDESLLPCAISHPQSIWHSYLALAKDG